MLMQMNVPMYEDGTVEFHATFVALVRYRLGIYRGTLGETQAKKAASWASQNQALRDAIKVLWSRIDDQILALVRTIPCCFL